MTLQADITLTGAPEKLIAETVATFGRLDVLVNNAGGLVARTVVGEIDDGFYDRVMDLNVRSLVHAAQAAVDGDAQERRRVDHQCEFDLRPHRRLAGLQHL